MAKAFQVTGHIVLEFACYPAFKLVSLCKIHYPAEMRSPIVYCVALFLDHTIVDC